MGSACWPQSQRFGSSHLCRSTHSRVLLLLLVSIQAIVLPPPARGAGPDRLSILGFGTHRVCTRQKRNQEPRDDNLIGTGMWAGSNVNNSGWS